MDLSQSDIEILYGLQADDDIPQCVSSWIGIFKNKFMVHGQIRHTASHFKNGRAAM